MSSYFVVGGRYRNRKGWYEVIDICKKGKITYRNEETNEVRDGGDSVILERIDREINRVEQKLIPYNDSEKNNNYFRTLGYLCNHGFIEAIIPPQSKSGFDENYKKIKGHFPGNKQNGYYIHHDANVDKWGVEMRLTFDSSGGSLDFGGKVNIVGSPEPGKLRINSNALCYDLLSRGFDLGDKFDVCSILERVPLEYKDSFKNGLSI